MSSQQVSVAILLVYLYFFQHRDAYVSKTYLLRYQMIVKHVEEIMLSLVLLPICDFAKYATVVSCFQGILSLRGMTDAQGKPILFSSCNDNSVRLYELPS